MKKFVFIILAIGFIIPLFAVPTSAASYDLGTPRRLYYTTGINQDAPTWKFASIYSFDYDTLTLSTRSYHNLLGRVYSFYAEKFTGTAQQDGVFELGTPFNDGGIHNNNFLGRYVLVTGFDQKAPFWCFQTNDDVRSSLYFDSFVYENLMIPLSGQYLRVSFSYDAVLTNVPQEVLQFIDINTLCFMCDTSGRAGYNDRYSLPKVYPTTSTVTKTEKNTYEYNFFFNLTDTAFSSIEGNNLCLGVRIPFYFNTVESYQYGIKLFTNANIPSTYDILNIGGYEQALDNIQSSVDNLTNQLVDIYTDQSSSDLAYVSRGAVINSQVTNAIGDYNDALKPLDSARDQYTAPPMQSLVGDKLRDFQTEDVKQFFSVPWVVSALTLVFAFSIIRLILYGTKEG